MKILKTGIEGLYIIELEPKVDDRGFFVRSFCQQELSGIIKDFHIVQVNHTMTSKKGTIRGMHFQYPPACETKIARCIRGSVYDVVVDLRYGSETYLKWYGEILSADNMKMLIIPIGFAHGFQTLEDNCEMLYLHSEFYQADCEDGVRYNDPMIGIDWPLTVSNISERDMEHSFIDSNFEGIRK